MVDKGPFVRHVWSLAADDAPSHHPLRHPATPLDGRDPATWWLRVERQTTLPLPDLGAAAFFIRVLHQPLVRAVAGPGRRARMASAVRSMDAALRAYKGLAGSADALLAWIGDSDADIVSASAAGRSEGRTMDYDLSLVKLPVRDVERAAAFYRDVLGMTPSFVAAEYGWAQFTAGSVPLALYVPGMGGGDGEPGGSAGFHLALGADAFEALAERLRVAGALVDGRVHRGADGTVFVDARDPDGNVIKVVRAARED
jgi:catechol 2,3-dioxygenase-like lactoylglutathione lyase family enzyme